MRLVHERKAAHCLTRIAAAFVSGVFLLAKPSEYERDTGSGISNYATKALINIKVWHLKKKFWECMNRYYIS